jgi:hypothetical protein
MSLALGWFLAVGACVCLAVSVLSLAVALGLARMARRLLGT